MKGVEEGARELVVTCGDGAVDFEMTDHALDAIAFAVDAAVPTDCVDAMGPRRDHGPNAALTERGADGVGVVTLVGEQMGRARRCARGHGFERRAVRRLAAGEVEDERDALGITETMNFTGEPAPRAAKSLFAESPFCAGCRDMASDRCSVDAVAGVVRHRLGQPRGHRLPHAGLLQRRKRWYTVIHLPYFSGTSRQGAPVRRCHRMPFTMVRLSCAGRALRPRSAGSKSFSRRHSASLRSPRLKVPSSPRGILEFRV